MANPPQFEAGLILPAIPVKITFIFLFYKKNFPGLGGSRGAGELAGRVIADWG
jgi:hypothetical protein